MIQKMAEEHQRKAPEPVPASDPGLRRLLTYTFIALVLALVLAVLAVDLVIRLFDTV
jgi:hypothetical protein